MEHKSSCGGNGLVECPQGCGLGLKKEDLEFHIKNQCSETSKVCETCGEKIFVNREEGQNHDCVKTLKEQLSLARAEVKAYEELFESGQVARVSTGPVAVHGQHSVPVGGSSIMCNQGHACQRLTGRPSNYGGCPRCDHCGQEDLDEHPYFYHCAQC